MSNFKRSRYQELVRQALQVVLAHSQSSLYDLKEQRERKIDDLLDSTDELARMYPRLGRLTDSYNLCAAEVRSHLEGRPIIEWMHPFIRTSLFDYLDCQEQYDSLRALNNTQNAEAKDLQKHVVLCEVEHELLNTTVSQVLQPLQVHCRLADDSDYELFELPVYSKRWGYCILEVEDCTPVECTLVDYKRQGNSVPFVDTGFQLILANGWDCQCGVRNRLECRFCVGCDKARGC